MALISEHIKHIKTMIPNIITMQLLSNANAITNDGLNS